MAVSTNALTLQDGSVFEGIAPTRQESLLAYPMYAQGSPSSVRPPAFGRVPPRPPPSFYDDVAASYNREAAARARAQQHALEMAAQAAAHRTQASNTSRLANVFLRQSPSQPAALNTAPPAASSSNLKRTPSERSGHHEPGPASAPPLDAKAAKKQAKETERLRREQAQKVARERARAVMQKKTQLGQSFDPLHHASRTGVADAPPPRSPGPSAGLDAYASSRYKARRRDDDDDVSVSSNETRRSNETRYSGHSARPPLSAGLDISGLALSSPNGHPSSAVSYRSLPPSLPSHNAASSPHTTPKLPWVPGMQARGSPSGTDPHSHAL